MCLKSMFDPDIARTALIRTLDRLKTALIAVLQAHFDSNNDSPLDTENLRQVSDSSRLESINALSSLYQRVLQAQSLLNAGNLVRSVRRRYRFCEGALRLQGDDNILVQDIVSIVNKTGCLLGFYTRQYVQYASQTKHCRYCNAEFFSKGISFWSGIRCWHLTERFLAKCHVPNGGIYSSPNFGCPFCDEDVFICLAKFGAHIRGHGKAKLGSDGDISQRRMTVGHFLISIFDSD